MWKIHSGSPLYTIWEISFSNGIFSQIMSIWNKVYKEYKNSYIHLIYMDDGSFYFLWKIMILFSRFIVKWGYIEGNNGTINFIYRAPMFTLTIDDQLVPKIKSDTISILSQIGIELSYQPALNLLLEAGAKVKNGRVFFSEEMILDAVSRCPSNVNAPL